MTSSPSRMLAIVYGPPAVGKATICDIVAARSGAVVVSNQDTINFAARYLPAESQGFMLVTDAIRLLLIQELLAGDKVVLFTFVHSGADEDVSFIRRVLSVARGARAGILLIRLTCSREQLLQRVKIASRRTAGKLTNPGILDELLSTDGMTASLPFAHAAKLDTSNVPPHQTADTIITAMQATEVLAGSRS